MLFFQNIYTNDDGFFFLYKIVFQGDISYKTYIMQNLDKNIKSA